MTKIGQCTIIQPITPISVYNHADRYKEHTRSRSAGTLHQHEYIKSKAKRKRSTHLGHEEEKRIMMILHSLQGIERRGSSRLREELTQLYIKPLPEYIQHKLRRHEETHMSRSAILFEELFADHVSIVDEKESTPEIIRLPEPKPHITSKWQQKMLTKLDKLDNSTNITTKSAPQPKLLFHPHLNRQLQVQGQNTISCCSKQLATPRYKPPISVPVPFIPPPPIIKEAPFSYHDPLPEPVSVISTKDTLSAFEERILQLEKMERDSILMERSVKPKPRELGTTRVPSNFIPQPKYLETTLAFQSKVATRKAVSTTSTTKTGRAHTPTNGKGTETRRKLPRQEVYNISKRKSNSKITVSSKA